MSDAAALNVIKTHKSNISNSHRNHENLQKNSSSSNNYDNSSTINIHKSNISIESNNASSQNNSYISAAAAVPTPEISENCIKDRERTSSVESSSNVNSLDVDCDIITSDSR